MWRSFSHWVGGMGVLVFIMAFLPLSGARNLHIMKAESPGPEVSKLVPRVRKTAGILYLIYTIMTATQFVLLLCGGFAFADKKTLAQKHALSKAKAQLKNAYHEEVISDALSTYLQVRYHVHTASLPLRDISAALKQKACPAELIKRFEILWQKLDAARFAPVDMQGEGTHELAAQALALIRDMDKESKK